VNNVALWQYFVIGGPCFIVGCVFMYLFYKDYTKGLEDLILEEKKDIRTTEDISNHLLNNL